VPTDWFRIIWLVWLLSLAAAIVGFVTTFLIIEIWALLDPEKGDTLTEVTRSALLHPGSVAWWLYAGGLVATMVMLVWLAGHMLGMGKLPRPW
jgi:hypothetical protein